MFLGIFIFALSLRAQLVVAPPPGGNNYLQLIQNSFIGGGVTVSNVTYNGLPTQIGSFSGNTNMQLNSGIIMCTGNINTAPGPNNSNSAGTNLNRPGFPQLNGIAGATTYDGCQLQFDFVPLSNTITFRYIFASEEYPEFVNSGFNDAFAFFINGPGFGTWTNLALVPNTTLPVTIDNINANTNNTYYTSNAGGQTVQYDGFTRALTATATVQPCQTYTLRIMIADGGDHSYDSAVFLGDNSFIGGTVTVSASSANSDTSSYEGCSPAFVNFNLAQPLNQPFTVNFTVGGTATNGVDYQNIPNSITIPAGQTSVQLPINSFQDNIVEGVETMILTYQAPCGPVVITVFIRDVLPLSVVASPDVSICNGGGPVGISAQASGGLQPYTYTWNNGGGNGASIQVNPANTTTYTVTVTSACPGQAQDQVVVTVASIPTSTFTTNSPGCPNVPVTVTYTGTATANATYNWTTTGSSNVSGNGQGPIQVTYPTDGAYNISLQVTENGCTSPVTTVPVTINPTPSSAFSATPAICQGGNALIGYTGTQLPGATYNWNFAGGTIVGGSGPGPYQITWNTPGIMNVTLNVTAAGCPSTQTTVPVTVYAIPTSTFALGGPVCEGTALPLSYTGTADTAIATFTWDLGGGTIQSNPAGETYTIAYASEGQYNVSLTVTENGCVSPVTTLPVTIYDIPTSDFTVTSPLCAGNDGAITYTGTGTANASYTWNFDGGNTTSGTGQGPYNVNWTNPNLYNVTLTVTENGCVSTLTSNAVTVFNNPTSDFTASTDLCLGTASVVNYTGNASTNATYTWDFSGGTIASGSNQGPYSIDYANSGSYNITLVVVENGCTSPQTTVPVTIFDFPIANAGADVTVCSGQQVNIGSAPVPNYSYEWINTLTDIVDPLQAQQQFSPNNTLSPIGPEVRVYTLQVKENGCISTDDVTVTINPQPVANFTAPAAQCFTGNTYNFTPDGSSFSNVADFVWDFGTNFTGSQTSTSQNPTGISFTTVGQQTVTLTITDYGCTDTYTAQVDVSPDPVVNFTADNRAGCPPLVVTFTETSGYTNAIYDWSFGDQNYGSGQTVTHTYTQPGVYSVTLTLSLSSACTSTITLPDYITVYPTPTADFTLFPEVTDQLNPTIEVTNTSNGSTDCSYDFGDYTGLFTGDCNPIHTYIDTGTYVITQYIVNQYGCEDTHEQSVRVNPAFSIYIPTAFTPDGNNINDVFTIKGIEVRDFTLYIFNRWGQNLFTSYDINVGWDGRGADGEICQDGVYPFRVLYTDIFGMPKEYIGSVTLIR